MDPKALKKLADACRKAGISHFKNAEVEFTLSDNAPISNYKKRHSNLQSTNKNEPSTKDDMIKSDSLTEDQLLFYSVRAEGDFDIGASND